ncbi:MAG: GNAT family N-acetyltransferase [Catalinimonas sp.]
MQPVEVIVADASHFIYAEEICRQMEAAARVRGTGIAKRHPEYIRRKMAEGKAIIARHTDGRGAAPRGTAPRFAGFCYIETWGHGQFVANSGLIVDPDFRGAGLAKRIKARAFELTRQKYPDAKLFGITTSLPVMKINSELGYQPVTFSELTTDESFWQGCQSCVNYDILMRTERKHCLCTGMLHDPSAKPKRGEWKNWKVYERWLRAKRRVFGRSRHQPDAKNDTETTGRKKAAPVLTGLVALMRFLG